MAQAEASTSNPPPQGQAATAQAEDVDWSSVDQVAMTVSKATLAGMQELWRQHAATMDLHGQEFAGIMYASHSQVIQDIAGLKDFDLKRVLELLNAFSGSTRETVLTLLQEVRRQDDDFTAQLYQTSRSAFSRNLRAALEARDAWYREKLRGLRARHEAQLTAVRHAAQVEMQQRQMQLKLALARALARGAKAGDRAAMMTALGGDASHAHDPATSAPGATLPPLDHASTSAAAGGAQPRGGATTAAMAAVAAAAAAVAGHNNGTVGAMSEHGASTLGPEAAMLEELFEDANAADALARELEAGLSKANGEILELRGKLDASQASVQEAQADASQWRSKWAVENTKTDAVKREAMAIISKCDEHVAQLQQQHIAELSQRDYLLQRCKDTIAALEAATAPKTAAAADDGATAGSAAA